MSVDTRMKRWRRKGKRNRRNSLDLCVFGSKKFRSEHSYEGSRSESESFEVLTSHNSWILSMESPNQRSQYVMLTFNGLKLGVLVFIYLFSFRPLCISKLPDQRKCLKCLLPMSFQGIQPRVQCPETKNVSVNVDGRAYAKV
jgi:hypothetical protein